MSTWIGPSDWGWGDHRSIGWSDEPAGVYPDRPADRGIHFFFFCCLDFMKFSIALLSSFWIWAFVLGGSPPQPGAVAASRPRAVSRQTARPRIRRNPQLIRCDSIGSSGSGQPSSPGNGKVGRTRRAPARGRPLTAFREPSLNGPRGIARPTQAVTTAGPHI